MTMITENMHSSNLDLRSQIFLVMVHNNPTIGSHKCRHLSATMEVVVKNLLQTTLHVFVLFDLIQMTLGWQRA